MWHQNDEMAHYDYIWKLAHQFRHPASYEKIAPEIAKFSANSLGYPRPENLILPDYGLGLQGYSYEAHQTPFYYYLMSAMEALASLLKFPMGERLRILRLLSALLMITSWLIFLEMMLKISRHLVLSTAFALLATGILALFSAAHHYHISNDQAGLLCGVLIMRTMFNWQPKPENRHLYKLVTLCLIAALTKLSNILWFIPVFLLKGQYLYTNQISWKTLRMKNLILSVWPLLMGIPFFLNNGSGADNAISETARLFSIISPGMFDNYFFLDTFLRKAFALDVLNIQTGNDGAVFLLLLMVILTVLWVFMISHLVKSFPHILWSMSAWPIVLFTAAFLNRHVGSVFWFEFRIFSSFYPPLILFFLLPIPLWHFIHSKKSFNL